MTQLTASPPSVPAATNSVLPAFLTAPTARYVVRRLGQSVLTIFLTLTTVFVLIRMAPGDPAYSMAGK